MAREKKGGPAGRRRQKQPRDLVQLHVVFSKQDHTSLSIIAKARRQTIANIVRPTVMDFVRAEARRLGLDCCGPLDAAG